MAEAAKRKRKTATGRKRKPAAKRGAAKRKTAAARRPRKPAGPPTVANGYLLVSVFGMFNSRALVEMDAERAVELFGGPLAGTLAPSRVIDATEKELAELAERAPQLAASALAAAAVALAYEIQNPFNSATSKSMCARELRETMTKLRELAPAADEEDGIDQLADRRAARRRPAA